MGVVLWWAHTGKCRVSSPCCKPVSS